MEWLVHRSDVAVDLGQQEHEESEHHPWELKDNSNYLVGHNMSCVKKTEKE